MPEPVNSTAEKILCAAARVFARHGYSAATVQQVADEAGVTKPTVYNHFKGKAELYRAVMDAAHQDVLARIEEAAALPGPAYDRVVALIESQVAATLRYADLVRVAHSVTFLPEHKRPEVDGHQYFMERFEVWHRVMEEGVAAGELQGDPRDLAMAVFGMVSSVSMARAMLSAGQPLDDDVERRLWDVIYQGAKKR